MQTCNSLAKAGYEVVLVTPKYSRPENVRRDQLWEHYNLPKDSFSIVILPTVLTDESSLLNIRVQKFISHLLFSLRVLWDVLFNPERSFTIISRCLISTYAYWLILPYFRRFRRIRFFFELHSFEDNRIHRFILKRMDGIFCITENLQRIVCRKISFDLHHTMVARMGVNLSNYREHNNIASLRKEIGLPEKAWIAMYTGKVSHGMKEIVLILNVAQRAPEAQFVLVGGKPEAVAYWRQYCDKESIKNVFFAGFVSPAQISRFQLAANALLLYYPGDLATAQFTSPGKMMEYMAAGRPIVAVNFVTIQEVLRDGENSLLLPPDQPALVAETINKLIRDPALGNTLGRVARSNAVLYTWDSRALAMRNFIISFELQSLKPLKKRFANATE